MAVSGRERDHMRRLGEFKARGHAEAAAAHLALPRAERLARSIALMQRFLGSARQRDDTPAPFYERARRLGLYRL
jgi:hypothetical protein